MRPLLVFSFVALSPALAGAQTTCTEPDTAPAACEGSSVVWCEGGVRQEFDCTALQASCGVVDGLGEATCVVEPGDRCAFEEAGELLVLPCGQGGVQSSSMGCDLAQGCVGGVSPCAAGAGLDQCAGTSLALFCGPYGQPLLYGCSVEGGACVGGACVMPAGASCDGDALRCEAGTACTPSPHDGMGRCAFVDEDPVPGEGEGEGEPDDSEPDVRDDGSAVDGEPARGGAGPVDGEDAPDRADRRRDLLRGDEPALGCAALPLEAPALSFLFLLAAGCRRRIGGRR